MCIDEQFDYYGYIDNIVCVECMVHDIYFILIYSTILYIIGMHARRQRCIPRQCLVYIHGESSCEHLSVLTWYSILGLDSAGG